MRHGLMNLIFLISDFLYKVYGCLKCRASNSLRVTRAKTFKCFLCGASRKITDETPLYSSECLEYCVVFMRKKKVELSKTGGVWL
jgi:transposase-like protein